MALYRGVKPVFFDSRDSAPGELRKDVVALLKEKNLVEDGDIVILTHGDRMETIGATDAIKIIVVE